MNNAAIKPLFVNFYNKIFGSDFNLNSVIRKLRYTNNYPTLFNGFQQGILTSGQGQLNIGKKKCPIVIIPDIGASKIFAIWSKKTDQFVNKLDSSGRFETAQPWKCRDLQETWTKLWFPTDNSDLSQFCWKENIKMVYDGKGGVENVEGVQTMTSGMGKLDFETNIYDTLINGLQSLGYVNDSTLFGASYDFRKIFNVDDFAEYSVSLTNLIERSVGMNGGRKAILIGHGLGSVVANLVLVNLNKQWKDQYIECFMSINGSFGGNPKALRVFMSGENLPSREESKIIRNASINFTGLQMLLPRVEIYGNLPLVYHQEIVYTAQNIRVLLEKVGKMLGTDGKDCVNVYNNVVNSMAMKSLEAPGVVVYAFMGDNLDTESSYNYGSSLIDNPTKIIPYYDVNKPNYSNFNGYNNVSGDKKMSSFSGDGTNPKFAMSYILGWTKFQNEPVHYKFYDKGEHVKILMMENPMKDLLNIVKEYNL